MAEVGKGHQIFLDLLSALSCQFESLQLFLKPLACMHLVCDHAGQ